MVCSSRSARLLKENREGRWCMGVSNPLRRVPSLGSTNQPASARNANAFASASVRSPATFRLLKRRVKGLASFGMGASDIEVPQYLVAE